MPKGARKKTANGYKMPKMLPSGTILQDNKKKEWVLGPSIGKGGFGEIYSAEERIDGKSGGSYSYVIKIEPHENGPLFVEMHFYMKCAKKDEIEKFMKKHHLKTFGMPSYIGSGSHEHNNEKYRFIVMEKFGYDISQVLKEKKSFTTGTAFKLALQMLYVLEYIHSNGYIHADLKGSNILMGNDDNNKNQAYLVDFGLATKYSTKPTFCPDPKRAHDGTIEFLSRDAHKGVPTRRGDLEVLAFNIIHWLGGVLPWKKLINDPNQVHLSKEESMKDVKIFLKKALGNEKAMELKELEQFLNYINDLEFNEEPLYEKIRNLFISIIKRNGEKIDNKLELMKIIPKRKGESIKESPKKVKLTDENGTKPKVPRKKVETKKAVEKDDEDKEIIMTKEMQRILAKKQEKENKKVNSKKTKDKKEDNVINNSADGFNDEMREIYERKETNENRPKRNVASINYKE